MHIWWWIGQNSTQLELIVVFFGTIFIAYQVWQSQRNIGNTRCERTVQYLNGIDKTLSKADDWISQEEETLKGDVSYFQELAKKNPEYYDNVFHKVREHLSPIVFLYYGLVNKIFDKKITNLSVYTKLKSISDRVEKYIEYLQEDEKSSFTEVKDILVLLKK